MWNVFRDEIISIRDRNVPERVINTKCKASQWMKPKIMKKITRKNKLWKKWIL